MATPKITIVPCWERRFVSEYEAIGLLNISKPEWLQKVKPYASLYIGNNFDIEQLIKIMMKQVQIQGQKV